jgi:hypothetical protein
MKLKNNRSGKSYQSINTSNRRNLYGTIAGTTECWGRRIWKKLLRTHRDVSVWVCLLWRAISLVSCCVRLTQINHIVCSVWCLCSTLICTGYGVRYRVYSKLTRGLVSVPQISGILSRTGKTEQFCFRLRRRME